MPRTIRALFALMRSGSASKWRLRGRYWQWRTETAFGDYPVKPSQKLHAMIEYGAWLEQMNRSSRGGVFAELDRDTTTGADQE